MTIPQRILLLLSDGMPHSKAEIRTVLGDELMDDSTIRNHMKNLRKQLPPGEEIVCMFGTKGRKTFYRHMRILASANDGRT